MDSKSAAHLEKHLKKTFTGLESADVSYTSSRGVFIFNRSLCNPRAIVEEIEVTWRNSFLISLIFGLPVMAVMIYFHWYLHRVQPSVESWHVFPGISLDNLLLFLLCTPLQLYGGRYYYRKSFKSLKHCTASMDLLITLATTVAYLYSVCIMISAAALGWSISPATFFDVPPMLFMFVSLELVLKNDFQRKTSDALSHLMSLQPMDAVLVSLGDHFEVKWEKTIDAQLLQPGDTLKVRRWFRRFSENLLLF
ncbi:unnamed protein product [Soboliphyme baturini]|uniref:Cation_ATPase_C domain-containing protein n=1 Tax=Soboliphyme baturini TaxID=241478 RepID=A0A183IDU0_9BILA|nr:unnamed protein product [Soboliphyme baturini]